MRIPIYPPEEATLGRINCPVCGDGLVRIRGRYPKDDSRDICATCAIEMLEMIKSYFDGLNEPAMKMDV